MSIICKFISGYIIYFVIAAVSFLLYFVGSLIHDDSPEEYEKKIRKRCRHDKLVFVENISGDRTDAENCRSIWACEKCGRMFELANMYPIKVENVTENEDLNIEWTSTPIVNNEVDKIAGKLVSEIKSFLSEEGENKDEEEYVNN